MAMIRLSFSHGRFTLPLAIATITLLVTGAPPHIAPLGLNNPKE